MVLLPAPTVIEAPGDCDIGVPLALVPLTKLIFAPFMVPVLPSSPERTLLPVWAKALPVSARKTTAVQHFIANK